jgi:hypothetical protein
VQPITASSQNAAMGQDLRNPTILMLRSEVLSKRKKDADNDDHAFSEKAQK